MKTNKKILLVEDDSNFGRILKEYLSINKYNVDLASNGIEGYEKFTRSEYDLCILDVMMPYKDGFTLAKEIREKNDQKPIIFLTAKTLKEYRTGDRDYSEASKIMVSIAYKLDDKEIEALASFIHGLY